MFYSLIRQLTEFLCPRFLKRYLLDSDSGLHKKNDDVVGSSTPLTFEEATAAARNLSVSTAVKLRLYGLYKQATVGDAPLAEPAGGVLDAAAPYKWRSWSSLRGTDSAAARRMYVQAVAAACGGGGDGGASRGGDADVGEGSAYDADAMIDGVPLEALDSALDGFAGPVMSAMTVSEEDAEALAQADRDMPLHGFARQGDARSIRYLLGKPGTEVDATDEDDHTPLHWACDGGFVEAARALLDAGATVDAQNCDGSTPLHMACACEHLQVAQLLCERGACTSTLDGDGCTPKDLAPTAIAAALGL